MIIPIIAFTIILLKHDFKHIELFLSVQKNWKNLSY